MMGRSRFLFSLLLMSLLALSAIQGYGKREVKFGRGSSIFAVAEEIGTATKESLEVEDEASQLQLGRRELIATVEDYSDPGANVNPRNGAFMSPPPPPMHP